MAGNRAGKKTNRGNKNPPSPATKTKGQDGRIDGLQLQNAIVSLPQHDADIMKSNVAAVTEAVLSQLTGNSDFVTNIIEAMSKCGPILDRVKQAVYESVSI